MRLWRRAIDVTVGTTKITGLRMSFRVQKDGRLREANTAEIKVWNLSPNTRATLQQSDVPVLVMAGYEDSIGQLFRGTLRGASHARDGVDIITALQSGDGEKAMREARINESFAAGAQIADVLQRLAESVGVNAQGAIQAIREGRIKDGILEFANGVVLSGGAADELERLLKRSGLEASVQDGQLQVVARGQPTDATAVLLASDTGLVGSPEIGKGGAVKAKSLLQPAIYPGRKVEIRSLTVAGFFRAEKVSYVGDTHGQDWYTEMEGRPL